MYSSPELGALLYDYFYSHKNLWDTNINTLMDLDKNIKEKVLPC